MLNAGRTLAVFAIAVDAKDERAAEFYEGFGFRRFPLHPNKLFLLASSAAAEPNEWPTDIAKSLG